jgi:hypothetical protein
MPMTEKDRKRNRRQRRQKRIRSLKLRYEEAKDKKSREIIAEKIHHYERWWVPAEESSTEGK